MSRSFQRLALGLGISILLAGCGGEEIEEPTGSNNSSSSSSSSSSGAPLGPVVNLATGMPTTASEEQAGNPANNAIDGDMSSRWSSQVFPQWLQVDLGAMRSLTKTELITHENRAYQFIIEVSSSASGPWTQLVDRGNNTAPGMAGSPISDLVSAKARYVRLKVTGASGYTGDWVSINEFRIFGHASGNIDPAEPSGTKVPGTGGVFMLPATIPAESYAFSQGEDSIRQGATDGVCSQGIVDMISVPGGCAIAYTVSGESVSYKAYASQSGRYDIALNASAGVDDSEVSVYVNNARKSQLAINNGGWDNYESHKFLGANFNQGENIVTIAFDTGSANVMQIDITPSALDGGNGVEQGLVGDLAAGKTIWDRDCAFCHIPSNDTPALTDSTLVDDTPTMEALVASIHASMPLGKPANCVDQCAVDVAAYIAASNPFFSNPQEGGVRVDEIGGYPASTGSIIPKTVSIARLPAMQFNNALRDLLNASARLDSDFPADPRIHLFNNNAKALFFTKSHIAAMAKTIDEALEQVFAGTPNTRVVPCDVSNGESCARSVATDFGKRAWRRPLTNDEVNALIDQYKVLRNQSANNKEAMKLLVKSILMSPNFMYRIELDANPNATTPRNLTQYEIATRLAAFIWASVPDDTLLNLADQGKLNDNAVLIQQVTRMLADTKSDSLIDDFAAQWLEYTAVEAADRSSAAYPQFSESLMDSMAAETRAFIHHIFKNDLSIREVMTANYTFLNAQLASFYGAGGSFGGNFVKHNWGSSQRRTGILGHGSVLTVSAGSSDEPAPVTRGVWVLERVLCKKPADASADVMDLFPTLSEDLFGREKVELHRTNPICANCHALMDPIGFGLQNFDGIGGWRDEAFGEPLNTAGSVPGLSFTGPVDLSQKLAATEEMPFCFANHLATYALGRHVNAADWDTGSEPSDYPLVYHIFNQTRGSNHKISDMIKTLVLSDAFRKRRGSDTTVGEAQ